MKDNKIKIIIKLTDTVKCMEMCKKLKILSETFQ